MKLFVNVHDIYGINTMDVDPRNIYEDVRNALQKQFPDAICDGACNFIFSAKSIQAEAQNWNENLHNALNAAVENYKKAVKYNSQLACDGKMLPPAIRTLSMAVREMDDEFSLSMGFSWTAGPDSRCLQLHFFPSGWTTLWSTLNITRF